MLDEKDPQGLIVGVYVRKDYEARKKSQPKKTVNNANDEGPVQKPVPHVVSESVKTYVLQDPESRNFSDKIAISGKDYERVVVNGILKTKEIVLADFMKSKGWFVLDVLETEDQNGFV